METITVQAEGETLEKLKEMLLEWKLNFKVEKEKPYNPEFVKMILERSENAKKGNVIPLTKELRKELFGDI